MKRDLAALQAREHDVLVIGGGIAGAWTVWEAASRGLAAALIELDDFGQASSWSSLKTAHGGLRHLQRLDIAGFRESMRERRALLRVAPEIVRPLTFAIPVNGFLDRLRFFLGGIVNDVLSIDRNDYLPADRAIGISRVVGRAEAASLWTKALPEGRAFLWQDAQITHTERLLLSLLHAAAEESAVIVNHCRIESSVSTTTGFEIKATDVAKEGSLVVRARSIVNASGAQIEAVSGVFGETCGSPPLIRGVNVVLGSDLSPSLAVGARDQDRYLFLAPWLGRSILGTLYDDGTASLESLVHDLLEAGRRAFPLAKIQDDQVKVVHAGHVPGGPDGEPIYRSRLIAHQNPRLLSILTAKYTTARVTAQAAIDQVGRVLSRALPPSVSSHRRLVMARPLSGTLVDRLRSAEEDEMALSRSDAVRGRLPEGALGEAVAPEAFRVA
ncbi:MAG: FAD-dependent oxidoreductase [Vicinamibacteria bacterium]|nr:FAD-dependent oxidoreductase [Vicinamibacteria bacterium]